MTHSTRTVKTIGRGSGSRSSERRVSKNFQLVASILRYSLFKIVVVVNVIRTSSNFYCTCIQSYLNFIGGLANFVPWVASIDRKLAATVKRIKDGLRETHDEYSRVTREVEELINIDCKTAPTSMTKDFLLSKMDNQIGDKA